MDDLDHNDDDYDDHDHGVHDIHDHDHDLCNKRVRVSLAFQHGAANLGGW